MLEIRTVARVFHGPFYAKQPAGLPGNPISGPIIPNFDTPMTSKPDLVPQSRANPIVLRKKGRPLYHVVADIRKAGKHSMNAASIAWDHAVYRLCTKFLRCRQCELIRQMFS